MCTGRRDRAILTGLGGSGGICHLAVLCVFTSGNTPVVPPMIQKDILRRLLARFYFLPFSAFFPCLACYSYRVRELLVCWLFFSSLFASIALLFLAVVLAGYAGRYLMKYVSVVKTVIPELAVRFAELPPDAISEPRILVAGALGRLTGSYACADPPDSHSGRLINVGASIEASVSNCTDSVRRAP